MPPPDMDPRWLKLKRAVWYSDIGEKRLVSYAKTGKIVGFQDPDDRGAWVFDRLSIDSFRENQNPQAIAKRMALDIIGSVT